MAQGSTGRTGGFLATTPGLVLGAGFSCLLWGSAFPAIKIGNGLFGVSSGDVASQLVFAGVRFFLAGLMVLGFLWARTGRRPSPARADLKPILLMSVFQTSLHYAIFYPGVALSAGSVASVINGAGAFVTILFTTLVFRQERLTARKALGCLLGLAGIVVVNATNLVSTGSGGMLGNVLVLASTVCSAVASCLIKRYSQGHDLVLLSGCQFAVGGLMLCAVGLAAGGRIWPSGPEALVLLAYMGFISAGAYSVWSLLIAANPVSRVTVFSFMNPLFGTLLSMALLGESQSTHPAALAAALALVCTGIVVVNRQPQEAKERS